MIGGQQKDCQTTRQNCDSAVCSCPTWDEVEARYRQSDPKPYFEEWVAGIREKYDRAMQTNLPAYEWVTIGALLTAAEAAHARAEAFKERLEALMAACEKAGIEVGK